MAPMTDTRDSVEWLRMMRDHSAPSDCKPHFARIADEITRLRSQRVAVPEGWQDISTAPRDGTWFLAWGPLWRHPFPAKFLGPTTTLVWIDTCEAEARGRHEYATHWMPRPTPPSAAIRSLAHGDSNDR